MLLEYTLLGLLSIQCLFQAKILYEHHLDKKKIQGLFYMSTQPPPFQLY